MFLWTVRICIFSFMAWTMSIPGTECYISPFVWSLLLLWYWFAMGKSDIIFNIFYE